MQVPADANLSRAAAAIAGKGSPVPLPGGSPVAPSTPAAQGLHAPASAARSLLPQVGRTQVVVIAVACAQQRACRPGTDCARLCSLHPPRTIRRASSSELASASLCSRCLSACCPCCAYLLQIAVHTTCRLHECAIKPSAMKLAVEPSNILRRSTCGWCVSAGHTTFAEI